MSCIAVLLRPSHINENKLLMHIENLRRFMNVPLALAARRAGVAVAKVFVSLRNF